VTDPRTLADRLCSVEPLTYGDLNEIANSLRHHQSLLDAIGDPNELAALAFYGVAANGHGDDLQALLRRIADAARLIDGEGPT
jgi:hypothetical protein